MADKINFVDSTVQVQNLSWAYLSYGSLFDQLSLWYMNPKRFS